MDEAIDEAKKYHCSLIFLSFASGTPQSFMPSFFFFSKTQKMFFKVKEYSKTRLQYRVVRLFTGLILGEAEAFMSTLHSDSEI